MTRSWKDSKTKWLVVAIAVFVLVNLSMYSLAYANNDNVSKGKPDTNIEGDLGEDGNVCWVSENDITLDKDHLKSQAAKCNYHYKGGHGWYNIWGFKLSFTGNGNKIKVNYYTDTPNSDTDGENFSYWFTIYIYNKNHECFSGLNATTEWRTDRSDGFIVTEYDHETFDTKGYGDFSEFLVDSERCDLRGAINKNLVKAGSYTEDQLKTKSLKDIVSDGYCEISLKRIYMDKTK